MRNTLTALLVVQLAACMPTDVDYSTSDSSCERLDNPRYQVSSKTQARDLSLRSYCIANTLEISGDFIDLTDFEGLVEVGELRIVNNPQLASLDGLSNVKVKKGIVIEENPELEGITNRQLTPDPNSLKEIVIDGNTSLSDISAFRKVRVVSGDVNFIRNAGLADLGGFEEIAEITGSLVISDNSTLGRIRGFSRLTRTGADMVLSRNGALTTVDGFSLALGVIGRDLIITDNTALVDASGFSLNIDTVNGAIRVEGNSSLSQCRADEFEDIPDAALVIDNNGAEWDPCY